MISPILFTLVVSLIFVDLDSFIVMFIISGAIQISLIIKAVFDAPSQHLSHLPFKIGEFAERQARKLTLESAGHSNQD